MKIAIKKQLSTVLLLITISSIQPVTSLPIGNTTVWWFVYAVSIFVFIKAIRISKVFSSTESENLLFVQLLLLWYLICIIRGCFVADNYWEWKHLVKTGFTMMIPFITYLAISPSFVLFITQKWLHLTLPLFFVFFPFLLGDGTGRYLAPVSVLLLFFPIIPKNWKFILLGFSLFIFLGNLDARSNLIKFSVPLFMSFGIYLGIYKSNIIIKVLYYIMFSFPIVLFLLGISGIFNVFKMDDYILKSINKVIVVNGEEINLVADTRTPIYKEVIESSIKNNYYIWGQTPARGNESEIFGNYLNTITGLKKKERFANEVSILNIFTWTGIVGVFLYFLIFLKAGFLAVFKSNNQYARLIGLYISFRWCYAWVEDFTNFDLSYLFLWITIGLCYSVRFREMKDLRIKLWIRCLFQKKSVNS